MQAKIEELEKKRKVSDELNSKKLYEKIRNYEKDWIPISKHEEIVNSELEKLENEYQVQLSSAYSQAVSQVELRVKGEIENIQREKDNIESYANKLESLNKQLRTQLDRKANNLTSTVRFPNDSLIP